MHQLVKSIIANYLSLYLVSTYLLTSFVIQNGIIGYTKISLMLSFVFPVIKPLLKIVLFPLNLLTLGLFDLFLGVIIIYLMTLFVPELNIASQHFSGLTYGSLRLEAFILNRFWVMFLASILLNSIYKVFMWLMR